MLVGEVLNFNWNRINQRIIKGVCCAFSKLENFCFLFWDILKSRTSFCWCFKVWHQLALRQVANIIFLWILHQNRRVKFCLKIQGFSCRFCATRCFFATISARVERENLLDWMFRLNAQGSSLESFSSLGKFFFSSRGKGYWLTGFVFFPSKRNPVP